MAVALLIGLWVRYQLSYDRFFAGYERACQVRFNYSDHGVIRNQTEVCLPLGDALKKDIPEVEHVAPVFDIGQQVMVVKDKRIYGDVQYVGGGIFAGVPFCVVGG